MAPPETPRLAEVAKLEGDLPGGQRLGYLLARVGAGEVAAPSSRGSRSVGHNVGLGPGGNGDGRPEPFAGTLTMVE